MEKRYFISIILCIFTVMLIFSCKEPENKKVLTKANITNISVVSSTEISVIWSQVPDADYYIVKWFTNSNGILLSDFTMEEKTTSTSIKIKGLTPNTAYVVYVYAYTSDGKTKSESDGKDIKTPAN